MNKEVADLHSKKGIEGVGGQGEQERGNTKRYLFSLIHSSPITRKNKNHNEHSSNYIHQGEKGGNNAILVNIAQGLGSWCTHK